METVEKLKSDLKEQIANQFIEAFDASSWHKQYMDVLNGFLFSASENESDHSQIRSAKSLTYNLNVVFDLVSQYQKIEDSNTLEDNKMNKS